MLNEDKIKLMTGIAIMEKKDGKQLLSTNCFFKGDYLNGKMIRSFFHYTICYLLCMIIWILYHIEQLINTISIDEIVDLAKKIGFYYLVGLIAYELISFAVYFRRYDREVREMKMYVAKLKRLDKRYEFQVRTKELAKEGGRK